MENQEVRALDNASKEFLKKKDVLGIKTLLLLESSVHSIISILQSVITCCFVVYRFRRQPVMKISWSFYHASLETAIVMNRSEFWGTHTLKPCSIL